MIGETCGSVPLPTGKKLNKKKSKVDKLILGTVVKVCSPRRFAVKTGHKTRCVHSDHIIRAYDDINQMKLVNKTKTCLSYKMIML